MALEIESPHRSIFDIESLSTMADTPIGLGTRPCAEARPRPVWPAGAARAADWPRLAEAWGSLVRDLALTEASGASASPCAEARPGMVMAGQRGLSGCWPRLAEARGSLRHALALEERQLAAACAALCPTQSTTANPNPSPDPNQVTTASLALRAPAPADRGRRCKHGGARRPLTGDHRRSPRSERPAPVLTAAPPPTPSTHPSGAPMTARGKPS